MKRYLIYLLILMLLPLYVMATNGIVGGESERLPLLTKISEQKILNGEHAPLTFTGTDTVSADGGTSVTRWMQLGSVRGSSVYDNELPQTFNPEHFVLIIELDTCAGGDSVGLGEVRFQMCQDTTETDLQALTLTTLDSSFTIGEIVTGHASGATGVIYAIQEALAAGATGDSILYLHSVEGTFEIGTPDNIEGTDSGSSDNLSAFSTLKHMTEMNNDGSSIFCVDGSLTNFATWVSEEISKTIDAANVQKHKFPLRVLDGGYIRFQFTGLAACTASDVKIHWELKCEH